ncbi:MAG TPA: 50S ribosomal protein L29 [Candidatus Marinimicrobia bacterium]|jgi:large subunit ribosomal protein L29|nr:50S ribosomal protein L29 [Candidatus Neomarinimicrobiota bacterium]|tara:strand:+ start:1698 stop:1910 length:213 start_codon:yes stop_codon:yes gene_type:complete
MKNSQLNEMSKMELETKLNDNMDALQNLRFQKALQQIENPLQLRVLKREIAQVKTVLRELELGIRKKLTD